MKPAPFVSLATATMLACGIASAQQKPAAPTAPVAPAAKEESEVIAEPVPPEIATSAVAAVAKLGDEVVLGRYQAAIEHMNPAWKKRAAARIGGKDGMAALEKQLAEVAAQMVRQGISMISFKPQGQPRVYQVSPGRKLVKEKGTEVEKLVYTKWLVLVPTLTKFRIIREGSPKPLVIESIGYQVAVSDKGRNEWTFIDGAGLKLDDLRDLFLTLPRDMELPPVEKREAR